MNAKFSAQYQIPNDHSVHVATNKIPPNPLPCRNKIHYYSSGVCKLDYDDLKLLFSLSSCDWLESPKLLAQLMTDRQCLCVSMKLFWGYQPDHLSSPPCDLSVIWASLYMVREKIFPIVQK